MRIAVRKKIILVIGISLFFILILKTIQFSKKTIYGNKKIIDVIYLT
jgi:hypothetical protein